MKLFCDCAQLKIDLGRIAMLSELLILIAN